ncbi:type I-E CRISPR-associated protein Cse1/CasA [Dermatophilus congolensis]|uniref:type I-E CRISPR-associated protein Cse1/CasA n=1 Tax=Dermatophilus congolensis TaxID=1863 RepID=UPI001AAF58C9|nr:type I-E CRISPR-associated protein Cse1/CasA [Dermatophilus congolensis]MBO3142452.1 type I-E CRISPR-associated protein Cse1/CasA [Dermatophilus congolensis]MBO3151441.1 type I-E CRISPR-associated protein Cse1/CasA [Dermatophilus congolensis]MBO3161555.1 type I-E CRISPR-associated protein Cse1/CasA [Dermatophilus congolensis]MBO3162727.1 type I-E CRISPR-associated protein Cse1/CasA [Dermatophilus congolensis]MBO3176281.1 type I-E CRISPR-associated protein Cse1/CasA [Dermatophilus congolensi
MTIASTTSPTESKKERTSFSLLTEPWLLARSQSGEVEQVSLLKAFERAHEITGLGGEIPTQEAACLRLMLAILYRAINVPEGEEMATWEHLWEQRRLPVEQIHSYLLSHADRFDLIHPHTPFYQVAELHTASNKTSGLGKIIAEVPDGAQFFTTRAGQATDRLSFAEAARWLVHVHAYDCSGIKSGAVGDDRVKGGKGYPIGIGFTGWLGLIILEGRTLAETLLLNLSLRFWRANDLPPWEREPNSAATDLTHPQPQGPVEAATWQGRRVRLIHNGFDVVDVVLANGDPLMPQNRQTVEPMTSWRFSEPQTKKANGITTYMPLTHQPSRALWRGLGSVLGERTSQAATKANTAAFLRAGSLEWLSDLVDDGIVKRDFPMRFRAIGMEYGSQSASVTAVIDDRLELAPAVIADPLVRRQAIDAVDAAEEAVRALGRLATNLADASGRHLLPGMEDGPRSRAGEMAYTLLDLPYRTWVGTLTATNIDERRQAWQQTVWRIANRVAGELVQAAGTPALVGRTVNSNYLNTPIAENFFRAALKKALPYAFPQGTQTDEPEPKGEPSSENKEQQ